MGIDNNAILFVGKEFDKVNLNNLLKIDGITQDIIDGDDLVDSIYYSNKTNIRSKYINDEIQLIGIMIGDSGSYSCIEYCNTDNIIGKIKDAREEFFDIFEIEPVVYLFNRQW